jgi:hypothetical protein
MDILLLCLGCFIAGLGLGGLLGMAAAHYAHVEDDRPAVTPWGESTALWSEVDWHWYETCGRHSDPRWAAEQRGGVPWYTDPVDRVPHP